MTPKVSIIMPVFNAAAFLDDTLCHLKRQTLKDLEIICVDDDSTDHSLSVLQKAAEQDQRIIVLHQSHKGAGAARNLGLAHARGEYVVFLDSDDFFAENLAQDAYNMAVCHDADVVLYDAQYFDEVTNTYRKGWFLNAAYIPEKQPFNWRDCPETFYQISTPSPWTKMFRRQFLLDTKLQFQTLRHTNDTFFILSALAMAERVVTLDKVLVYYRVGQTTNLQSTKSTEPLCFYTAYKAWHDQLESLGILPKLLRSYSNQAIGGCLYNLRSTNDLNAKKIVFDRLREEIFQMLDIPEHDAAFYFIESNYNEMLLVKNGTFEQYLAFRTSTQIRDLWHSVQRGVRFIRSHPQGSKQYKAAMVSVAEQIVRAVKSCSDESGQIAKYAYEIAHDTFNREEFSAAAMNIFPDARLYQEFTMIQRHEYDTMQDMLSRRMVVSLTSYPGRIHSMAPVLDSLYNQDRKADEIILWLAEEEFPEREASLPEYLTELVAQKKLTIRWCDNLKPHKKYFYALQQYPEDLIVTVDDDLLYSPNMLSSLYRSYLQYPDAVSAVRVHLMLFSEDGRILPYNTWIRETDCCLHTPSMQLFATGGAGTLYPPHLFRKEFFDKEAIAENSPLADDLWLKAMEVISGVPVVAARRREALEYLPGSQENALKHVNDVQQHNDIQLANIIRWTDETFGKDALVNTLTAPDCFHPILTMESVAYHLDQERRYFRQQMTVAQKQDARTKNTLQQTQGLLAQKEGRLKDTETKLRDTEAKRKETEGKLKTSEEKRRETEGKLKASEEKRRETECKLNISEEKRRETEAKLKTSEEKRRGTEARLKTSEEKRRETEAVLRTTRNKLRLTEESKPINRQMKDLGIMLKGLRQNGHSRLSVGFKFLIYGIAWIPEKILVFLMYYLRNGFTQTVKHAFRKIFRRG